MSLGEICATNALPGLRMLKSPEHHAKSVEMITEWVAWNQMMGALS